MKKDSDNSAVDNNVVLYCNISIITLLIENISIKQITNKTLKYKNKLQELVTLMLGNKYKTGLCPCTCWWLRRHLRKTCRFFSFSEIRLLISGVMPCVLKLLAC